MDEALSPVFEARPFDAALPSYDSASSRLRWRRVRGVLIPDGPETREFLDPDLNNSSHSSTMDGSASSTD